MGPDGTLNVSGAGSRGLCPPFPSPPIQPFPPDWEDIQLEDCKTLSLLASGVWVQEQEQGGQLQVLTIVNRIVARYPQF